MLYLYVPGTSKSVLSKTFRYPFVATLAKMYTLSPQTVGLFSKIVHALQKIKSSKGIKKQRGEWIVILRIRTTLMRLG